MISRQWGTVLLRPEDLEPSSANFEVVGVFNPGAVQAAGEVVMLVRVAEQPVEKRPGYTPLPRWDLEKKVPVIDWTPDEELDLVDPRVIRRRADGTVRLTFLSHLRVVRCGEGRSVKEATGVEIWPQSPMEEFGVEDPRITPIGDRFWITYVAVSRHGAATALASTKDFRSFERHGVIFCVENKDVVLFPERIGGEYAALHRPNGATPFTRPEIWTARSTDLLHWGRHEPLTWTCGSWETGRVGAGPPPIRTTEGWLEIYHGNRRPSGEDKVGAYAAGALLLDLDDPNRVLKRTTDAFFAPELEYERQGFVANVVFPTGIVQSADSPDSLLVYYGSADSCTAVVEFSLSELLATMR